MPATKRTLALFDVDGTLTPARLKITPGMKAFLQELRKTISIGVVGGSDFVKQQEQIGEDSLSNFDYSFAENGLVAYKNDELIAKASFAQKIGEDELQKLINWCRLSVKNELQLGVVAATGVEEMPRRLDAVDAVTRESTRRVQEPRHFRDAVIRAGSSPTCPKLRYL